MQCAYVDVGRGSGSCLEAVDLYGKNKIEDCFLAVFS